MMSTADQLFYSLNWTIIIFVTKVTKCQVCLVITSICYDIGCLNIYVKIMLQELIIYFFKIMLFMLKSHRRIAILEMRRMFLIIYVNYICCHLKILLSFENAATNQLL